MDYFPITTIDRAMHLKEPSLGTYKALKMITLRSVCADAKDKSKILHEFKLSPDLITDELDIEDYYKELFFALFLESDNYGKVHSEELNIAEINKAIKDFFGSLNGN